jgi:hypothetical protein
MGRVRDTVAWSGDASRNPSPTKASVRTIQLRTALPDITGPEFAEVVFEGVEGYVFHGDALGTILFAIEQVDALALYREHATDMQRVDWPRSCGVDPPTHHTHL